MTETLDHKLATLNLGRMRQVYASWIEQAAQTEMGYGEFLEQLVTEEVLARQENQLRRKMHAAGFPYAATHSPVRFHPATRTQTHGHAALLR
jgi:DNA replication protein DnaC